MDKTTKDRLVFGGLWVFGGRILSFLFQISLNAILARLLLPEDLGLYFLIFSLVNFFMMFAVLGMKRSIVRIVTESLALEKEERASQAVKNMLQLGLFTSMILAILLVSGVGQFVSVTVFGSSVISDIIYLPAIWLIIFTLQTLIAETFRGYHNIRCATIFNGLVSSVISVTVFCIFICFQKKVNIQTVLQIIIISYAINLVISFVFLRVHTGRLIKPNNEMITRSELLKSSWMLYLTDIVLFIMTSGHLWLLAYFSSKENVAIYGAVMRLMVIITTALTMLKLTILPTIGHLYTKKLYNELEKVLRISATIAGLPAIIGLLLIILLGKSFLLIIYGSHYTAGYSALVVLATANLINVLTGSPGPLIVMASKEKYLFYFALVSGLIGMILSGLLVVRIDYLGVSIGAGVGIILYNVMMVYYCRKEFSINTMMSFHEIYMLSSKIKIKDWVLSGGFRKLFKLLS
jgi:O-antigen/teichoic acid export membrane protein